ncbi:MAG: hypothetical protein NVS4B3_13200 [Gemmatimonadaceae bacterium]
MKENLSSGLAALAFVTVACTKSPSMAQGDMQRDLDAVSVAKPELAPPGGGRIDVVSAVERSPVRPGVRAPLTGRPTTSNVPARASVPPLATVGHPDPSAVAPRPRPMQRPETAPQPYKTEAEVIRGAPFPINP